MTFRKAHSSPLAKASFQVWSRTRIPGTICELVRNAGADLLARGREGSRVPDLARRVAVWSRVSGGPRGAGNTRRGEGWQPASA